MGEKSARERNWALWSPNWTSPSFGDFLESRVQSRALMNFPNILKPDPTDLFFGEFAWGKYNLKSDSFEMACFAAVATIKGELD